MIKESPLQSVAEIFSLDRTPMYEIPSYQREYTWGKDDILNLFYDILDYEITDNSQGYFLGSCISTITHNSTNTHELIDGQQRLTTLSLLMLALYDNIKPFNDNGLLGENKKETFNKLKKRLVYCNENDEYIPSMTLQKQNYNNDDYLCRLKDSGLIISSPESNHKGNRRIYRGYGYCDKLIKEQIDEYEDNDTKIKVLFSIVNKVLNARIVHIYVDSVSSAYTLFEAINNRGVPLSALDLIKNKFISKSNNNSESEAIYNQWMSMLNNLGDDATVHERFLIQYYNAFIRLSDKNDNSDNHTKARKNNLIKLYEILIDSNHKELINDLVKKSKYYSILLTLNNSKTTEIDKEIINLYRIQGAPSYLLLLYLLSEQDKLNLTDNDIKIIIHNIVVFSFRRSSTNKPASRNMIDLYIGITDSIRNNQAGDNIKDFIRSKLKEVSSDDEDFKKMLYGSVYKDNREATRFILNYLEAENRSNQKEIPDLWEKSGNKPKWTIEHIFPEGKNIPDCWVKMIANGSKEGAEKALETHAHKLGNLTITAYNSELSNKPFDEKTKYYKNGLWLNENVINKREWTADEIDARTEEMVTNILNKMEL